MERGALVDAETQTAITKNGEKVIDTIKQEIQTLKDDLKDNTMLLITPIKSDVERLRVDIDDLYNKDRANIEKQGHTEARMSSLEANRVGRDTQEERGNRSREINYLPISIAIAIISVVGSIVFALYKG